MSRSVLRGVGKQTFVAIAFVTLFLVCPKPSRAQNVYGISEILPSNTAGKIDTFSATEVDYYVWYYYAGFYVNAYLCQTTTQITTIYNGACPGNSQIDSGTSLGLPYYYDTKYQLYSSGGSLLDSYTAGDFYTLISWHYLQSYFIIGSGYYDPYGFGSTGSSLLGGTDPSGTNFPGSCFVACAPVYVTVADILAGLTAYEISSAAPQITIISPGAASVGSSGTIQLQGTNLVDSFGDPTTANISNSSGITYSIASQTPTQVNVSYSITTGATTGTHSVTLSTYFGTSNAVSFNVGDPTPVVTSVNPNVWPAGVTNLTVTITGKGFGTNPSVSASSGYVTVGATSNPTDTSVQVSISVSSSAPNQTVTVSVQSNGYNGNGFIATTQGQSSMGSNTATLEAIPAAIPQIVFFGGQGCSGGTNITGTTQSVTVGQEISLCASYTVPQGLSVIAQNWTSPPGTAIGGYNASTSSGSVIRMQLLVATNNLTFYWVDSGNSRTITYNYSLNNGASATASATFNVAGPSGTIVSTIIGAANVERISFPNGYLFIGGPTGTPSLALYGVTLSGANTKVGITFSATGTSFPPGNPGAYSWVQLVNKDSVQSLQSGGLQQQALVPSVVGSLDAGNPAQYPYQDVTMTNGVANDTAYDAPYALVFPGALGEIARSFSASMYLLWTPTNQNSACTGNACTIPVPLGTIANWGFSGDMINTLNTVQGRNTTTWILNCGPQPSTPAFQQSIPSSDPNQSYPVWDRVATQQ
jgi:hypothetical protein